VRRSGRRLAANAIYGMDSQSSMANTYGRVLSTGSTIEQVMEAPVRLRAVTVEEANNALRTVFAEDRHHVTGRLLPEEGL